MSEWDHQVVGTVPDRDALDTLEIEPPVASECEAVVHPSIDAMSNTPTKALCDIVSELPGQVSPIRLGQQRLQRSVKVVTAD